jgi:tetratricopeptide (TPR) repeat protein
MATAAREHMKNALRALRARDGEGAERELDQAIEADAGAAEAWQLRGIVRLRRGRPGGAEDLERAGALVPSLRAQGARALEAAGLLSEAADAYVEAGAWRAAGDACLRVGRYHDGIAYLRRALESGADVRLELCEHLRSLGDPEAACEVLAAVSPRAPTTQEARALLACGRFEDAATLARALRTHDAASNDLLFAAGDFASIDGEPLVQARLASWQGRHEEALALAQGDSSEAARIRGVAHLFLGDSTAASELDRAIEGGDGEALVWRAELHVRAGRRTEALDDLDRGIERMPGHAIGAHAARVLMHLDSPIHVTPPEPEAYRELTVLLDPIAASPAEKTREALTAQFRGAVAAMHGNRSPRATFVRDGVLVPFDPPRHSRFLARELQEKLRVWPADAVCAALRDLIAERPDEPTIACHLGEVELWLGRYADAEASFRHALDVAITTRWAYVGLAAAALGAGRFEDVIRACAEGEKHVEPGRTQYIYRGEALRRLGQRERALDDLARSTELTPSRISGTINLALVRGDEAEALAEVRRRAPALVADAAREAGDEPRALLEHILAMMRGNRSSSFVTYFTAAGELRFVPNQIYTLSPSRWRELGF